MSLKKQVKIPTIFLKKMHTSRSLAILLRAILKQGNIPGSLEHL